MFTAHQNYKPKRRTKMSMWLRHSLQGTLHIASRQKHAASRAPPSFNDDVKDSYKLPRNAIPP